MQTLIFFGNVVRRNANVESEIELSFGFVGRGFAFHLADSAFEHLRVELEADGFDVAALLAAKHVTGAAEFEIEGGDFESRTQVGKFLERGEAASGDGRELDFGRQHEIGVGAAAGSSDAAAELVELGEAEAVGTVNQDRVAQRDVETVFDDCGGDEDVGFLVHEFEHHFFEFAFRHLSVADDDARGGNECLNLGGDFPDGVDAVVNEIDLAAALEFLFDGGLD